MAQEEKSLLMKDLCSRLPYGIKVEIISYGQEALKPWFGELSCKDLDCFIHDIAYESIKPYLRPMSSMTEEERKEYNEYLFYGASIGLMSNTETAYELIDWLNKNMFDYRGLIPLGLAIEVTEENNPYED